MCKLKERSFAFMQPTVGFFSVTIRFQLLHDVALFFFSFPRNRTRVVGGGAGRGVRRYSLQWPIGEAQLQVYKGVGGIERIRKSNTKLISLIRYYLKMTKILPVWSIFQVTSLL